MEHKRGRSRRGEDGEPAAWESDALQAAAYALLLEEHAGRPVAGGGSARGGRHDRSAPITRMSEDRASRSMAITDAGRHWARKPHTVRALTDVYGCKQEARVVEAVARWHNVPDRPLKVVAIEPMSGGRPSQAFYSTCPEETADQVRVGFAGRWSIEETNRGDKGDLGFEEPQGWSRLAVLRTAPIGMLLYSLIVVWFARVGHTLYRPLDRPWYWTKAQPSFADMLRTLRRESLLAMISAQVGERCLPQNLVASLLSAANAGP